MVLNSKADAMVWEMRVVGISEMRLQDASYSAISELYRANLL